MLSLKPFIGHDSKKYRDKITSERITKFCQATGVSISSVAPPTFLTLFRQGELEHVLKFKIDLSHLLHTEQEYEYEEPLSAGDQIIYSTRIKQVLEKQTPGTHVQFVIFETTVHAERLSDLVLIGKSRATVVIRQKGSYD